MGSPFEDSEVWLGGQWASPIPGRGTAPLFSSSSLAPLTWDRLVALLSSLTCSTPAPRMLVSSESHLGILAGCPVSCRAAVSNDPVILWIWVWVERNSALMPACSQEREFPFLGEKSLFSLRSCSPAAGITTLLNTTLLNYHLIPAKISRLVHFRAT